MVKRYLKYRRKARGAHAIHSPFVFEFFTKVLSTAKKREDREINELRRKLLRDRTRIEVTDLGAGSRKDNRDSRAIANIAKTAGISRNYGKLLANIIDFYQMQHILELGTSLGIGTAYLSQPDSVKKVISIEGCPNIHEKAFENLNHLARKNVTLLNGEFSDDLPKALDQMKSLDMVFIDGNHTFQATKKYIDMVLPHLKEDAFLILDDINWSAGMRKIWEEVIAATDFNVSIELFRMGILVKRSNQHKEHFILKF